MEEFFQSFIDLLQLVVRVFDLDEICLDCRRCFIVRLILNPIKLIIKIKITATDRMM